MAKVLKPNILFLGIDSLRRDHLSCYGYPRLTSPHLDRLAAEGTLFEDSFSPHIPTPPGYAGMLCGRDVFGTDRVSLREKGPIMDAVATLPEMLREQGYKSIGVGLDTWLVKGSVASDSSDLLDLSDKSEMSEESEIFTTGTERNRFRTANAAGESLGQRGR